MLAFLNARFPSIQTINTITSTGVELSSCLNADFDHPGSAIEYCNIYNNTSLIYQGIQKISGYLTGNIKNQLIAFLPCCLIAFSNIALSDNNYLLHNYPSHNFW